MAEIHVLDKHTAERVYMVCHASAEFISDAVAAFQP